MVPMDDAMISTLSGQISQLGEKIYFDKLKNELEKDKRGEYLVLDVEDENYVVDPDKLIAINKAREQFGEKLFFILQIGTLQKPVIHYRSVGPYAWSV